MDIKNVKNEINNVYKYEIWNHNMLYRSNIKMGEYKVMKIKKVIAIVTLFMIVLICGCGEITKSENTPTPTLSFEEWEALIANYDGFIQDDTKKEESTKEKEISSSNKKNSDSTEKDSDSKIEEPDKTDIYFAAMDYIDGAIEESLKTEKYVGKKYSIEDKKITKIDSPFLLSGTYNYVVKFVVKFEGVSQKYIVTIDITATYLPINKEYKYKMTGDTVDRGGTLY